MNTDKTKDFNQVKNILRNHIKGLIYGQCLGDAVGLQTEFKMKDDIFGVEFPYKEKIRNFPYCDWTDDSDQMILLLETILESDHDFYEGVLSEKDLDNFAKKLLEWKNHGFKELGDQQGLGIGGTVSLVLNCPGFLDGPIEASKEIWNNSGKKLAANGALMRTSILSILNIYKFLREPTTIHQDFYRSVRMMCLVTHFDVRCIISCWMLCYFIQHVLYAVIRGDKKVLLNLKNNAYRTMLHLIKMIPKSHYPSCQGVKGVKHQPTPRIYSDERFFDENENYIIENELVEYCKSSLEDLKLDEAAKIGYTYKCLGCVFWVMDIISKYESKKETDTRDLSFEKIIIRLVQEGGDADTNAAAAGSLLGSYLGYDKLPKKWIEALPHREWLDVKIDKLFEKMKL